MKKKAVFFDLFETLVFPPERSVRKKYLVEHNLPLPKRFKFKGLIGFPWAYFCEALEADFITIRNLYLKTDYESLDVMIGEMAKYGKRELTQDVKQKTKLLCDLWNKSTVILPGVVELLSWLKEENIKLALISNSQLPFKNVINKFQLEEWFDLVLLSHEVGVKKPKAEIFQMALERLGVSAEEVIMIGDSFGSDVEGALAVGIDPIWVNFTGKKNLRNWRKQLTSKRKPVTSIAELKIKLTEEVG